MVVLTVAPRSWRSAFNCCKEIEECERGSVDARACVNCDTLTYAHHTQIVMQSNFKGAPPPFIEEIQRDLRAVVQEADQYPTIRVTACCRFWALL